MSLSTRLIVLGVLAALAVGAWFRLTAHYEGIGYARAQGEARQVAEAQAERNRELQRAAEKRYTVQAEVRERVITETIVEVRHATASLASCPVPEPARRLLNDAAACAREDRPAACGTGEPVPAPG